MQGVMGKGQFFGKQGMLDEAARLTADAAYLADIETAWGIPIGTARQAYDATEAARLNTIATAYFS